MLLSFSREWFFFSIAHIFRAITDIIFAILSPFIILYYYHTNESASIFSNSNLAQHRFSSILITGGSSGIGKALAIELANRNPSATIIITGRNSTRLKLCENAIRATNVANVLSFVVDVRNAEAMNDLIQKLDAKYCLDLVVANAGISLTTTKDEDFEYKASSDLMIDINIKGVLNTVFAILPAFKKRKCGHLAIVGSLIGYIGGNSAGAYIATKAYLRCLCDDLRPHLRQLFNISCTYIAPGFVGSRMCKTRFNENNIGFMDSACAAVIIADGLQRRLPIIAFPTWVFSLAWIYGSLHPYLHSIVHDMQLSKSRAQKLFAGKSKTLLDKIE